MHRLTLAAVLWTGLLTQTATAQLLFATGFETPQYVVGQSIDGVDDWFSFISPDANQVVAGRRTAAHGRRALTCWGGDPNLQPIQGLLDGAWAQPASLDPSFVGIVHVSCDVRLDGPDTGSGPQDDLASANLIARNGVGGSAFMYVSSTGEVFCFAGSVLGDTAYAFATPVTLGCYVNLGITLNYATHTATFWVDRRPVGQAPFGGQPNEQFAGAILEFATVDAPAVLDPALYRGYWDDLVMLAIPFSR